MENLDLVPSFAWRAAGPEDWQRAKQAQERQALQVSWAQGSEKKKWAKAQGWRGSWFSFDDVFLDQMLADEQRYRLALAESGIQLLLPVERYRLSTSKLRKLDKDYQEGQYRWLVEELRDIRRTVEIGVVVEVEGQELTTFDSFYSWAHGRYYALEDDVNTGWIGDDSRNPA